MNKEEERLKKIINLARKVGPVGFMDAMIRIVDEEEMNLKDEVK